MSRMWLSPSEEPPESRELRRGTGKAANFMEHDLALETCHPSPTASSSEAKRPKNIPSFSGGFGVESQNEVSAGLRHQPQVNTKLGPSTPGFSGSKHMSGVMFRVLVPNPQPVSAHQARRRLGENCYAPLRTRPNLPPGPAIVRSMCASDCTRNPTFPWSWWRPHLAGPCHRSSSPALSCIGTLFHGCIRREEPHRDQLLVMSRATWSTMRFVPDDSTTAA